MSDANHVFIVDDDAAVLDSLSMLLDAAGYIAAPFPSAQAFLDVCTPDTRGCIILDVNMPEMDGLTLQKELTHRGFQLPVIFLSGHGTIPLTVRTIKAGAVDFLTKPVDGSDLLSRVQETMEQYSISQKQTEVSQSNAARLAILTEREKEITALAIAVHTSKEIAQRLNISYRTVEIHRARILLKTGTSSTVELARLVASGNT